MIGYRFSKYIPERSEEADFEKLLPIFLDLLVITSGDVSEAMSWMNNLDEKYKLSSDKYGMGDFFEDLKKKGYVDDKNPEGKFKVTAKSEQKIRSKALEEIFGKLKKSGKGNHKTNFSGFGDEQTTELKKFEFGDSINNISVTDSLQNAFINHGLDSFRITEDDLEVYDTDYNTSSSTVLMIDISHSMILYGEDRITPAKKVAMALAELINRKYPKDSLDIIVFGNDAWQIELKDLPYLEVGPYHTNTIAGIELAMDILRKRKNPNKQIFMITDGKPTCMKVGIKYYKNPFGLDPKIMNKTMNLARKCRKANIPITTFMIATDPWLRQFVNDFSKANNGKAYYSGLEGLGNLVFEDYKRNRRKTL